MSIDGIGRERRPSRAVALLVSALLVVVWVAIRIVAFDTVMFPLTYVLPLLIGVWTRDRPAVWGMAAIFIAVHTVKIFWLLPDGVLVGDELWANYVATMLNITIGAAAVHLIINLRGRIEQALVEVRAQAEELRTQGEELAQQNEELAQQGEELTHQAEELTQQGEELASQNEELQTQAEEIGVLNGSLARREALLQTLLETARLSGTEASALERITASALELFGEDADATVVYEKTPAGLCLMAAAGSPFSGSGAGTPSSDAFAELVLEGKRTAGLNDAQLRPDLPLASLAGLPPFRAALCAPIEVAGTPFGTFVAYSGQQREWTDEQFRLAEWVADQCGRVLQTLRVQSDLREADRRKSEFLATLSHELRNPLAPIGFALTLVESAAAENGQANAVRIMRRQLNQLVRLVDDLLDATRLSSNKIQIRKTRTDLVAIVQHVVEAIRPDIDAAGHRLRIEMPAEPVWLDADPDRIAQVVTNLLNNAARYTPAGGALGVAVTVDGADATLTVSDSGVGLDPADLERVFEMFTQVGGPGSGGLGIGLALVRGIVALHGGRVEARSAGRGQGAEFRVTLPRAAADAPLPPIEPMPLPARTGCRVLVVDDNVDSAEMMSMLLEMHGHTVLVAHDGERALESVHAFAPDVALLDIGLPGLNGYEVASRLRGDERTRHVRLVALTGWGQTEDRARARSAGFDTHLTKPADPDAILAAIADVRQSAQ